MESYGIYLAGVAVATAGIINTFRYAKDWKERAGFAGLATLGVAYMALATML